MHFSAWVDHESSRNDFNRLIECPHDAASLEAEIDLGAVWVQMVRADLAWFPASDCHVTLADAPEHVLDVLQGIPSCFFAKVEDVHRHSPFPLTQIERVETGHQLEGLIWWANR
jgi:hypothetical protein